MWAILKFDRKNFFNLRNNLKEKLGKNFLLYRPKLLIQTYKKNTLVDKQVDIMGDYLFIYHEKLCDDKIINELKFTRGLKYFLKGFVLCQKDIKNFIDKCKKFENNKGLITQSLFEVNIYNNYVFKSGPFTNEIFKIINMQRNKIDILINNFKTTIDKRNFLFSPV